MGTWYSKRGDRIVLSVKVIPGAGRSEISGLRNGEVLIRLNAPPERGKANKELLRLLSDATGVSKSAIKIESGETARKKTISVPTAAFETLKTADFDEV
jgi:uncharacterized protein